jgi:MFS family permease
MPDRWSSQPLARAVSPPGRPQGPPGGMRGGPISHQSLTWRLMSGRAKTNSVTLGRLQPMHRQILRLATAHGFFQTVSTLVLTIGALAGGQIAPAPHLATAPVASMFLGTAIATVPASMWMARSGRRTGFIASALVGALGALVAASAIAQRSLLMLSLGTLLIGGYQGFAQFYRFAASEVSNDAFRSRAISLVLTGGVAAAVLGPALAQLGAALLQPTYMGSFLIAAALAVVAAGVLVGLRVPMPRPEVGEDQPRPLPAIMCQPTYGVALFGAATGSGVMVLAMTVTPLAMAQHGHSLADAAMVIQMHTLGMFAPSFVTGSLIARFGVLRVMFIWAVLLSGHAALSFGGTTLASFASALVLLGVGWNFLYVGGTTLLTGAYLPAERGRAQAANDLVVSWSVLCRRSAGGS